MLCAVLWCAVHPENKFMHRSHFLAKPSNCKEVLPPWQKSIDGFSKKKPYCPIGKESDRTDWPEIIWICPWDVGAARVSISAQGGILQILRISDVWRLPSVWCWWHCILRDSVQWLPTTSALADLSSPTVANLPTSEEVQFENSLFIRSPFLFSNWNRWLSLLLPRRGRFGKTPHFLLDFFLNLTQVPPYCISPFQAGEKKECPYTNISFLCTYQVKLV